MKKIMAIVLVVLSVLGINFAQGKEYMEPVDMVVNGSGAVPDIQFTAIGEKLGVTPFRPSEFKTTLSQGKTQGHADTTLVVNSLTTKDGYTLDSAILGDRIVLHIAPGRSNAEIVVCTGLTAATKTFTGCTFGYRFDQNATASGNILAHSPGELIIISDDDHYLSVQYPTIDGTNVFLGILGVATTTDDVVRFYLMDSPTSTLDTYIWANRTIGSIGFASSTSGELAWNADGTTFSLVNPMTLTSGELRVATSTFDFVLRDSTLLGLATTTISNGTAAGTRLDLLFNTRFNATTTHPGPFAISGRASSTQFVIGTTNPVGNHGAGDLYVGGEATTTSSLSVGGDLCFGTDCGTWVQLADITTSAASATTTITAKTALKVIVETTGQAGAGRIDLYFNNDTTGTYGTKFWSSGMGGNPSSTLSANTDMRLTSQQSTAARTCEILISNFAATQKLVNWDCIQSEGAAQAPIRFNGVGAWNNTSAQITSITVSAEATTFSAGTRIMIYGSKN